MRYPFAALIVGFILSANSQAAKPDYRPSWSKQAGVLSVVKSPNSSVLNDPLYRNLEQPKDWAELFSAGRGRHARLEQQLKEEWSGIQGNLEARDRHHLMGQNEQIEASHRSWQLGKTFLRSLFTTRVRESLQKVEKKSDSVRVVVQAQKKLDFIATQGMRVEMGPQVKFGSRADFIQQRGRVWMESPWLQGALDFQFGSDDLAPAVLRERYQISLSRSLPWQLHSGLVFGGTSQTMITSLSKPLLPHLSCTLENRQNLSQTDVEQLARFNYQIRF